MGGNLLDNVSCFVLLGAADDQIFRPVHEFRGEAVAAARQLGANVRALKRGGSEKKKFSFSSSFFLLGFVSFSFWSDRSQLVLPSPLLTCVRFLFGADKGHSGSVGSRHGFSW